MILVFNTTFNNISVLLVEETGVFVEFHRPVVGFTTPYAISAYQH
jgi:hypothetical protein